jgi:YbbR domain-containing protein
VKRVSRLLFHNWPLKLAAVLLATMLYAGFVVSQSVQEFTGGVHIDPLNVPTTARLSDNLPEVTRIRYVAVGDASSRASADTFRATIDLANVDPEGGPTFVPIKVESVDARFTVVDYEPRVISVSLDPLKVRNGIRVNVIQGTTPEGLDIRPTVVTPATVSVRGPASVVDRVTEVQATVVIEPSGLDVDRDVDLIPVDALGDRVTPVDVEPTTAHVHIAVFSNLRSRPLPVTPVLSGSPAGGYRVEAIAVSPLLVSVEGEADQILGLTEAPTEAIQVSGATQDVVKDVALSLPQGVLPVGGDITVRVTVTIRPISATRGFDAAIEIVGREAGLDYRLSISHALATVGGPVADIDRINPAEFVVQAQVGGLGPGTHVVPLDANLPVGLSLVGTDPSTVTITITASPSPSPSPSSSASP